MSMKMKTCVLWLTVLILTLVSCRHESPVAVEVRPSEDVPGTVEVSLTPPRDTGVDVDESRRTATANFPKKSTSLSETVNGHSFIGVLATGNGDRVKVLAARQADNAERIRVIVETTRPLRLTVRFDRDGGHARGWVVETLPPGDHDVLATPAGLSE
jgi:hypothetical protein